MEADAAFARPSDRIVEHAVAGEDMDPSVVERDRQGDDHLAAGVLEDLRVVGVQVEDARRAIDLV